MARNKGYFARRWENFLGWWRDPFRERAGWTDKAIVVLTIGMVLVAFLQWLEMHDSGKQTDKIITAANLIESHQSQLVIDNKQDLSDNRDALNKVLEKNRKELAEVLQQNRDALNAQKFAANGELAAVQKQTEVSERPWVSASIVPTDGPMGGGNALTFGRGSVEMQFKFVLKNVGKSVALDVQPVGKLITFKGRENPFSEALAQQAKICGQNKPGPDPRNPTPLVSSFYLFPGDEKEHTLGVSIPYSELSMMTAPADEGGKSFISPEFVGCVEYRFSFQGVLHHTYFNFQLHRFPKPAHPGMTAKDMFGEFDFEVGQNAPASEIWITPSFFGGNDID